jgi:hypothetical protein
MLAPYFCQSAKMTQIIQQIVTVRLTDSQMKDPVALLDAIRVAARTANFDIQVENQPDPAPNGVAHDDRCIPDLQSPEWEKLNDRRCDLIDKKIGVGLTPAEEVEFEQLQEIVGAAIDKKYPRTPPPWEKLRELEARLKASGS